MAHREICAVKLCPDKSHARLKHVTGKRIDLCVVHAVLTKRQQKDNVKVVEEWGDIKVFDESGEINIGKVHFETKEEATAKEKVEKALKDGMLK